MVFCLVYTIFAANNTNNMTTMEHQLLFDMLGIVASLGLIFGYLPQAIQTMRTRNTDGISLPGFVMMALGSFCFMCQGIMLAREGIFMLITNAITCICSIIIFFIKIRNDKARVKS